MYKKLNFFEKILFLTNVFFVLWLLVSYLIPYLPPKRFSIISVLALLTPIVLIVNVLFSIYWLVRRKKIFLLSTVILLFGYESLTRLFQIFNTSAEAGNGFSLMSFNVRLFNHYRWHPDRNLKDKIIEFVQKQSADIIVFQEFYNHKKYDIAGYPHKKIITKTPKDNIGHAIFSRFPIINAGSLNFPNTSNNGVFVDIRVQKDTLRIYSLHLESLHIKPENELINQDKERLIKNISRRFVLQQEQMELFKTHQNTSPYKTIVCGDFNNTAYSYIYRNIRGENLNDAFEEKGVGFGKSFNFNFFPFRIDYILLDKSLNIQDFNTFSEVLSDHRPMLVKFSME
ncbi:endonuclease/exonuclease/phosphatase family protein [Capnocytophaga canis]|uniref:endonuclease/exonuclease/phosphatase family protein n=1 Tax=Capnocytophaga canis TaxID=1848903 RepID=UPI00156210B0|nr:endonuclease/exonuclease/phosphatase family protein [Capnocytophaga canis]